MRFLFNDNLLSQKRKRGDMVFKLWTIDGSTVGFTNSSLPEIEEHFSNECGDEISYVEIDAPPTELINEQEYYFDEHILKKLGIYKTDNLRLNPHYLIPLGPQPGPLVVMIDELDPLKFLVAPRILSRATSQEER